MTRAVVTEIATDSVNGALDTPVKARSYWWTVAHRLRYDYLTLTFGAIVLLLVLSAVFAPLLAPADPYETSLIYRLKPLGYPNYLLGTDELGRDMLSRLLYGGRISLAMGLVPVVVATLIGGALGIIAGYAGGRINTAIMRVMDVFYAFPSILLAVAISGALGGGILNGMLSLSLIFIPPLCRVAETATTQVRHLDFVEAARASGARGLNIIRHHILGNVLGPVFIYASRLVSVSIILASGLRFVSRQATVHAVNDISFSLLPGEVMCIIGESGSGKSVTLRSMMRLLPPRQTVIKGTIRIGAYDMTALRPQELSAVRGTTVAMIFQEPMTALDPVYTVGRQIAETAVRHVGCTYKEGYRRARELLELVNVPSASRRLSAYPHELSGGLRQRVMIAMSLSCQPSLLLADEPTTALDATVQIQVLTLLRQLQEDLGMAVIFVTHDLGVAAEISDKVAVMYAGRLVEQGPVREVLRRPLHPYTEGMLSATVLTQKRGSDLDAIPGAPPDLRHLPPGCSFAPRCQYALAACTTALPDEQVVEPQRLIRCIHPDRTGV